MYREMSLNSLRLPFYRLLSVGHKLVHSTSTPGLYERCFATMRYGLKLYSAEIAMKHSYVCIIYRGHEKMNIGHIVGLVGYSQLAM